MKRINILLAVLLSSSPLHAIKIIGLGEACTVGGALRTLNIRTEAYPFDWIVSPFDALYQCIADDFAHFLHPDSLRVRNDNHGVIDYYGFHFVHDFPTTQSTESDRLGEGAITESVLRSDWRNFISTVREKYIRRIERLQNILRTSTEKVYLVRHLSITKSQAIALHDLIRHKYPSLDFTLVIVNRTNDVMKNWNINGIRNFHLDDSAVWNNPARWGQIYATLGIMPSKNKLYEYACICNGYHMYDYDEESVL